MAAWITRTASFALACDRRSREGNVSQTLRVDEKNRVVYFLGVGKEKGRDPYFIDLYRIGLDGRNLTLLTPEDSTHERLAFTLWAEKWQGLLDGKNYDNQANPLVAKNLQGKLLLAHGTMDTNVPVYNTLLVVNELIRAN